MASQSAQQTTADAEPEAGPCPVCASDHTWVSSEDATANYCGTCRTYWRTPEPADG